MKILIADDDISTIDVLQRHVDWNSLGVTQVLRAYNGQVAMEIVQRERPELVLCDIEMPQADGLAVLRFLHEQGIETDFAFLTAHESFEYARTAVRYGAVNYLTKPLELDEIREALEKMAASARQRQQKKAAEAAAKAPKPGAINQILGALRDGIMGTDAQRINELLAREHVPVRATDRFRIICVSADVTPTDKLAWDDGSAHYALRYLAQEAIADRMDFSFFLVDSGERFEYDFLFVPAEQYSTAELERRCSQFISVCGRHLGIRPNCLIGAPMELRMTARIMPDMRQQAKSLRFEQGRVVHVRELEEDARQDTAQDYSWEEQEVLNLLKQRSRQAFLAQIKASIDGILKRPHGRAEQFGLLHHDLLQTVYTCLRDNNILASIILRDGSLRQLDYNAERSPEDMLCFAGALYDKTVQALAMVDGPADIIGVVKQYIAQHYREDIDRDQLAAVAYITPNYLSKLFRAETGTSLREYINQLRIQEAKRLLLTTNASVSDIALDMGFENISYFSTVFRKLTGVSPVDWRNQKGKRS